MPFWCSISLGFTFSGLLGIWRVGYCLWPSPFAFSCLPLLVHWRKAQEMQGAPPAEWKTEGFQFSLTATWDLLLMPPRRQPFIYPTVFFRHLIPSVYSSFHKPMSHVACSWVQGTSPLRVISEEATSEIVAVAGKEFCLGFCPVSWALFYNFLSESVWRKGLQKCPFGPVIANHSEPLSQIPCCSRIPSTAWGIFLTQHPLWKMTLKYLQVSAINSQEARRCAPQGPWVSWLPWTHLCP